MLHKRLVILVVALLSFSLFLSGCTHQPESNTITSKNAGVSPTESVSPSKTAEEVPFTARFEIYTLGTKRTFTNPRYHEQSSQVYLLDTNPSTVHVAEKGATWADLFASLPMSLNEECLITGTNQTFCTNEQHQLVFILNGQEIPQALKQEIKSGDFLEVRYE